MTDLNMVEATTPLEDDETKMLISADKVQGTAVYDIDGERVGSVDSIMLNKYTGMVAYSVMSFGGFLGIGERYHPLPWNALSYDIDLGGYKVNQPAARLKDAPHYSRDEIDSGAYASHEKVGNWYGAAPQPLI